MLLHVFGVSFRQFLTVMYKILTSAFLFMDFFGFTYPTNTQLLEILEQMELKTSLLLFVLAI